MKKANYSKDWSDIIRPEILKRDKYKCKKCFIRHKVTGYYKDSINFIECDEFMINYCKSINRKIITIYLQVHHINGNRNDNDYNNLITLCPRCHLKIEREFTLLKKKMNIIFKFN